MHDAQLLLNKQQQIWGGVYIHWHPASEMTYIVSCGALNSIHSPPLTFFEQYRYGSLAQFGHSSIKDFKNREQLLT